MTEQVVCKYAVWFSSVQFSRSVTQSFSRSTSLQPHELQHARLSCPSLSPRVCSDSVHWFSDAMQQSHRLSPFSSCPQSFPASGSFPMSPLYTSGGQSIETSASASFLSVNIQGWFPIGLTCLISLLSKELSSLFQNNSSKTSDLRHSAFFMV